MKPLVAVTRSGHIESLHWGLACVADEEGKVIMAVGDPETNIFFRSSAKPLQVIPAIVSGAAAAYGFIDQEIALACSSHTGTPGHRQVALDMLAKIGLGEENLYCGTMRPYDEEEDKRLIAESLEPSRLHCSCSGKHAAMLALAKFRGYALDNYYAAEHPVQQEITKAIARFVDEDPKKMTIGTDGCGAPIYLLSARKIAMSYARLVKWAEGGYGDLSEACNVVVRAMIGYPELVSGAKEFCAALMKNTGGRIVAKVGAEAVYCVGIRGRRLGVCVKISDGNERALYPAVLHILNELGELTTDEQQAMDEWFIIPVTNNLGQRVGEVRPVRGVLRAEHVALGMPLV